MKYFLPFMMLVLTSFFSAFTYSLPNITGSTGLITMPTAEILKYREYNVAIDYNLNLDSSTSSEYYYKFNVGALDNVELGFVGGTNPAEGVFLNLKWNLSSNTGRFPLLMAIGFENLTSTNESDFYIVSSKKLRSDLGLHAGFKALFNDEVEVGFMTGLDYAYSESLLIFSDITNTGNSYYTFNASSLYKLSLGDSTDNIYLRGSIQNLFRSGDKDTYFNLGICYYNVL
ncbi:hypothetical protein CL657_04250 [bacterium]|nr:hypothetical protein [bacterium]|tara:strand:+ start:282 stop:968 length:687 start_codon:yes stop_codon:yes gene_type:complete